MLGIRGRAQHHPSGMSNGVRQMVRFEAGIDRARVSAAGDPVSSGRREHTEEIIQQR